MKFIKSILCSLLTILPLISHGTEAVVLLHGIARTHRSMHKLEKKLTNSGYVVLNVHYPSRKYTLEELSKWLQIKLENKNIQQYQQVHFVTHSMGGLLARAYCHQNPLPNMGRLVMLGPPNHGSELANKLHQTFLFRCIYGPAGQQLTTYYDLAPLLGEPQYEVGIIAGLKSILLIPAGSIFKKPNDGMVSVDSTKLKGAKEHIQLPVTHAMIMQNDCVIQKAIQFLKTGTFAAIEQS